MKAHAAILNASYDPATVNLLGRAFDLAWSEVSHNFSEDEPVRTQARERLARAILAAAEGGVLDLETLKRSAIALLNQEQT